MIIAATSDTHGYLPAIDREFDLLLLPGDICPVYNHSYIVQAKWTKTKFVEWVKSLPYAHPWSRVVLTPGNHDFFFEETNRAELNEIENMCEGRLKILCHDMFVFEYPVSDGTDSLTIFGTPYCSIFGRWAFMVNDETLEKKFSQIPEGVDILMSHDSPNIGHLGAILEGP